MTQIPDIQTPLHPTPSPSPPPFPGFLDEVFCIKFPLSCHPPFIPKNACQSFPPYIQQGLIFQEGHNIPLAKGTILIWSRFHNILQKKVERILEERYNIPPWIKIHIILKEYQNIPLSNDVILTWSAQQYSSSEGYNINRKQGSHCSSKEVYNILRTSEEWYNSPPPPPPKKIQHSIWGRVPNSSETGEKYSNYNISFYLAWFHIK